ncbi:hypothetical protein [Bradyrhizobium japonicum]|nr:hypothetical protein [Bradyrhizobium japonicum]UQD96010.1 hypothetical protein JEY30_31175 [Bradyrhizobium japonicum]WLB16147.1 hypothetical protein QIH95_29380 [Bradyrhizobium japonicum]
MDATSRGDLEADMVRRWYEKNRESWWDRTKPGIIGAGPDRDGAHADEFMLRFIGEVRRVGAVTDPNGQEWPESNRHNRFWKPGSCHWMTLPEEIMTTTKDRLMEKVAERRRKSAVPPEKHTLEHAVATALDEGAAEIDALRASLEEILRTATVGTLGPAGYETTLQKIRDLTAQALART